MNFFGMGPMEILVIMVVALLIFGPGKLPEIGSQVGRAIREFRAVSQELTGEFERTINEVEGVADEVKQSARQVEQATRDSIRLDQAMTPASAPARSIPQNVMNGQPLQSTSAGRAPTKADPLADFMSGDEPAPQLTLPPAEPQAASADAEVEPEPLRVESA